MEDESRKFCLPSINKHCCTFLREICFAYYTANTRNVINRTSKHSDCFESHKPTKSELQEALLNALCQLDRLKKYRLTQKTRIDQLQERLDHMGSELDSSVDTIRHHQTNYEAQKRRTSVEINHLRNQLAKTTVLLDQFKLFFTKANLSTTSLNSYDLNTFTTTFTTTNLPK
ncbi:hypothetical protein MN116_005160 [Schistosoma mekongi]|uniref:Uncharacterized protein n=1 Tax=Schistosoma mekongi TaxID=38744 RepID=A0AAE2D559_SCHME|nr:hypothetical protein MN116_005160 [Schistosoma mekongi]